MLKRYLAASCMSLSVSNQWCKYPKGRMALRTNNASPSTNIFLSIVIFTAIAAASSEKTKTVEFNVKPGGVVHTFSEKIKDFECSFTYASQGGTNEQWQMSVGLSDDDRLVSCSVWRPQGKSYLFFTQFKGEISGTKVEFASAYSQAAVGGQKDVPLKEEEYIVGDSSVTHREGKFRAELSKLTMIARTKHDEL